MPTIEQRIAALEGQAGSASTISKAMLICVRNGETHEEALARVGCNPDDPNMMCIFLVPLSKSA
jgi:hypothetical protein